MSDTLVASRKYLPGARILLSDMNTRYRILKGSLLVHIVEYSAEGTGRRLPGYLFGTGSSLYGVDTGTLTLLADPSDEVLLEESPVIPEDSSAEEIISEMARWIHHLLFVGKSPKTKDSTWIQPGSSTVETGKQVQVGIDQHEVLFCHVENGAIYESISDIRFTGSSGWFPVTRATTFIAETDSRIDISSYAPLQGEIDIPGTMHLIYHWASCRVQARWDEFFLEEDLRIYRWLNQELQIRESIIRKKGVGVTGDDPDHVVFNRVLSIIRGDQGNPVEPGFTNDYSQARNLFEKISLMAEDAGVRVRQVRLPVSWWKEDNGPLLVINEKNKLLAAVPVSPGRYRLFDESGIIAEYNQISQIPLTSSGCMVYPSLPDRKSGFHDIVRSISPLLWKRDILYLVLFGMVTGILTTAIPVATGLLFSQAIPENNYRLLYAIVIVVAVSLVTSAIFDIFREFSFIRLYGKTGGALEGVVIDRVLKLPPRFFRRFNAGNLVSRIEAIESIRNECSLVIISLIFGGGLAVFNIILMYFINPSLTWIVLAFSFGILCASGIIGYYSMKKEKGLLEVQGHFSGITFQILNGIAKISSAGAENRVYLQWEKELKKQIPLKVPIGNYHTYSGVLTSAWSWTLIIMVFLIAGTEIVSGKGSMTQAWFMGYYSALGLFSVALAGICTTLLSFWTIIPMWNRVQPILQEETEVNKGYISPGPLSGAIELSHISFSYSETSGRVIDDLSLKIRPGEFVAVVGHSGGGKSTLMRILLGFETPDTGSVLYGDQDLSRLNIREVRKQIGAVLQDGQLMAGTIFENIAGSHSLRFEEAWEAAKIAGIADDINEMPLNMHTFISEGSTNISGGQKQRILIARAIASHPKILFFDEATSALDNIVQKDVADRLSSLHLTRLIIAHRLSTIVSADRIYVLDKGRIIEEGTYDELMKKGGVFTRLAQRQLA